MFTGLIEGVGQLAQRETRQGDARLRIDVGTLPFDGVQLGESIAVYGVCLTVVAFDAGAFRRRRVQRNPGADHARRTCRSAPR